MSLTYAQEGPVARVTFDDGKANVVSHAVLEDLHLILDRVERDESVSAVLFAGRPGRFSAGFDLETMTASDESMRGMLIAGGRLVARLLLLPKPVVAACTGHALAAGALVLLATDYRVGAAGEWKIGLNEVAIGLPMPRWGVELARYRLDPAWYDRRVVLGQVGTPEEAVAAGFLDELAPAEGVIGAAVAWAERLSSLSTVAVGGTKERARRHVAAAMVDGIEADMATLAVPKTG